MGNDDRPIEQYLMAPHGLLALISKKKAKNGTSQEGDVIVLPNQATLACDNILRLTKLNPPPSDFVLTSAND